jgi:5-formyltetrahydrofolate cyclo-ligase
MTAPTPARPIDSKIALRKEALACRAIEHARSAAQACELVRDRGAELFSSMRGQVVSGYLPIRDELSPIPLMQALLAAGRALALPCIEQKWSPLTFRYWRPGEQLIAVGFGLKEPAPTAGSILPDILLVPLAAFDARGYRIGYGGGYYDRTLELYRSQRLVTAIGVAYDCQEVPAFAHEPHDQPLDHLVTPSGVRSFGS